MANSYFPVRPEDLPVNYFPDTEELNRKAADSNKFLVEIAERYSQRNGAAYTDVKNTVDANGAEAVIPSSVTTLAISDKQIDDMYSRQLTPQEAMTAIENYQTNGITLATAGTATDVAEKIIIDPYAKVDRRAIDMQVLREEFARITPDEGVTGSVMSFLGLMARESTIGVVENFFQMKSGRGEDAFDRLAAEPDYNKKRQIAKEIAMQAKDRGILGDNSMLISNELHAIEYQGKAEYEGWWTALDLATLGAGKAIAAPARGVTSLLPAAGIDLSRVSQTAMMASARDSVDVIKAIAPSGADNAITSAMSNPDTSADIARHAAPGMNRVAVTSSLDKTYPTVNPILNYEASNEYTYAIQNAFRGQYVTEEAVNTAVDRFVTNLSKTTKAHVLNFDRKNIGLDNYEMTVRLGKDSGTPFIDYFAAERFAMNFGGKVVSEGDGFVVEMSRNLSLKGVGKATEKEELNSFLFDMIASPEVTSSQDLNTLLKRGTSRIGTVLQDIGSKHAAVYKKIGKKDIKAIDSILTELRDGKDSYRRSWYSVGEFKDKYYNMTGREANQNVLDAYVSSNKLNETAWLVRADKFLKSATDQNIFVGSFTKSNDLKLRSVERFRVPSDVKKIYDMETGTLLDIKDIKNRKIFQAVDGISYGDDVAYYVTGDLKSSRRLFHSDVFGYQPGGSRGTANVSNFVVQERSVKDISGIPVTARAKTVVAARTEKEAAKSATEINNILKAIRTSTGLTTGAVARSAIKNVEELTSIIRVNNGFNPSVETVDEFLKFMDDAGIGLDDVKVVGADDEFGKIGIGGLDYFQHGGATTYRDLYELNSNPTSATRDKILFGYGGGSFKMINPLTAIERDFARGVNYMAQRSYLKNASEGLLKGGEKYITNNDAIKNMGLYQKVKAAQFDTATEAGEKYAREQKTILSRMEEKSSFAQAWERRMNLYGQKMFDRFNYDIFDKMSLDPVIALRGFAFDLKLGLFNIDQFIVQSSSAAAIISISPKFGTQAALSYMPMRLAMTNPAVRKAVAKRTASATGMSEQQFDEMIQYMDRSGRFQIDQTIAEINGAYDMGRGTIRQGNMVSEGLKTAGRGIQATRKAGRVFFNEGERVVRLMANNVAYREFRLKFPDLDINTDAGFRTMDEFITHRADVLTMNMTSASAAGWQSGLLSIPTQWLSYNARMLENLFFGRNLKTGTRLFEKGKFNPKIGIDERERLLLGQLAFYGAAGWGLGGPLNALIDKSNTELDPEVYTLLRYGMADYLLSELTGVQTGLGGRLAVGEGMVDLYKNILDGKFVEVIGGPAGSIFYDASTQGLGLLQSVVNGDWNIAATDFNKVMRNISTWDKAVRATWIIQTGEYLSKKGEIQATGLSPEAAILNTLGAKLQEVEFQYDLNKIVQDDKAMVQEVSNSVRELTGHMWNAIDRDDMEAAQEFANEIGALKAPLTFTQLEQVNAFTRPSLLTFGDKVMQKATENGHSTLANQLQKMRNTGANQ